MPHNNEQLVLLLKQLFEDVLAAHELNFKTISSAILTSRQVPESHRSICYITLSGEKINGLVELLSVSESVTNIFEDNGKEFLNEASGRITNRLANYSLEMSIGLPKSPESLTDADKPTPALHVLCQAEELGLALLTSIGPEELISLESPVGESDESVAESSLLLFD